MYNSIDDAKTVLVNSGVFERLPFHVIDGIAHCMFANDKTAEQAVEEYEAVGGPMRTPAATARARGEIWKMLSSNGEIVNA